MDNQKTLAIGATLALVGVVVGAGSVLTAQTSARKGGAMNPRAVIEMVTPFRMAADDLSKMESYQGINYPDDIAHSRYWQYYDPYRAAAPRRLYTDISHCAQYSGPRLTNCIGEYINEGTIYRGYEIKRD